jgi:hypothetical protein
VVGCGFDPRMCSSFESIVNAGGHGRRDCTLIEFDEGPDSPSTQYASLVSNNLKNLENLLKGVGKLFHKKVSMWSGYGSSKHRISSRSAAKVFSTLSDFNDYTDIVIDISAIPRGIYFSLIGKIFYLLDHAKENNTRKLIPNVHIVVCENATLDKKIHEVGIDDTASYIHGFCGNFEMEATAGIPTVWIPILGEGQSVQLERIYNLVNPDEISPVLPSISLNPRRGDELLIEYRELLFDRWRIEPKNIIYASEQNPFETYRQIHRAACHYNQALEPLGGCKTVVSAVSSKLLSIGALLATYELKVTGLNVGLANIETQGYNINGNEFLEKEVNKDGELFTLWLIGECYE